MKKLMMALLGTIFLWQCTQQENLLLQKEKLRQYDYLKTAEDENAQALMNHIFGGGKINLKANSETHIQHEDVLRVISSKGVVSIPLAARQLLATILKTSYSPLLRMVMLDITYNTILIVNITNRTMALY